MIEGNFGAHDETYVGNFELCVAVEGGKIEHWRRANSGDGVWRRSATFGEDVWAVLGLLESSFGFNDDRLQHYWRDGTGWHAGEVIT